MENVLLQYMEKRLEDRVREGLCGPHPFVTISREFGCPSKKIGALLVERLNQRHERQKTPPWKQISKEILQEAAQQLNLDPDRVKYMFQASQTGILDDMLASFYLNSKSSLRIRKAVHDVILSFATQGYAVIVGRAGVAITQNCPNALHVRLQAPLEWRIPQIIASRSVSEDEAFQMATEMDKKRKLMIETFTGNKFDIHIFDIVFNCQSLSKEEIVDSVLHLMETKKMI